jgi:ArsR family transcriptional regulator
MSIRINDDEVVELAEMFRLMSDPTRLKIIFACLERPVSVGATAERLASRPAWSHHPALLPRRPGCCRRTGAGGWCCDVWATRTSAPCDDMADHVAE